MIKKELEQYIRKLGLAKHVYTDYLENKKEQSIGIYDCKYAAQFKEIFEEVPEDKYKVFCSTILVHWNKSLAESTMKALEIMNSLCVIEEIQLDHIFIGEIGRLYAEPIYIGTDENEIHEFVLEIAILYK